ncbi:MAG: type II toxin-antitoxin system VapC family toxin [Candidatus Electrothrix sp. EH2]|nr:type II toxin-antitoxin system VapC family toxin [Candidatus Electrothrix sp. EH2]
MILIDTHIWHWWVNQIPDRLPPAIIDLIEFADNVAVSSISCFEMAWLIRHGRIDPGMSYSQWFDLTCNEEIVSFLPVTPEIASMAVALPEHHKDPHDRMIIIATAIFHECSLISFDRIFSSYKELDGLLVKRPSK